MRRVALALALVLASPVLAGPNQKYDRELHGIKGPVDQRIRVEAQEFPWSAVGRLNNGQGGHCSGTLIGPSLVATAAHCLWSKRTQRQLPAQAFTFVAGYDRGEYLRASKIKAFHASPKWTFPDQPKGLESRADDWVLAELEEPVGNDIGWVALALPKAGMTVAVAGYGKDKAFVPLAHLGCRLLEEPKPGVLYHNCDAVQGESGGPVFIWSEGQLRIAAINVAVIPDKGEMGVAASVAPLVELARRLGASASTKAGPLSRPATMDLGEVLGPK